jgi:hypothetical protein
MALGQGSSGSTPYSALISSRDSSIRIDVLAEPLSADTVELRFLTT